MRVVEFLAFVQEVCYPQIRGKYIILCSYSVKKKQPISQCHEITWSAWARGGRCTCHQLLSTNVNIQTENQRVDYLEIPHSHHATIIFTNGLIKDNAGPFTWGKLCFSNESNDTWLGVIHPHSITNLKVI